MRWVFRIMGALLRGGFAFVSLLLVGWLWLMAPSVTERQALGLGAQVPDTRKQDIVTMRLARALLAAAPGTTLAALARVAPEGTSTRDLREALEALASGEAAQTITRQRPGRDTVSESPVAAAPVQITQTLRTISGAKFQRPPKVSR